MYDSTSFGEWQMSCKICYSFCLSVRATMRRMVGRYKGKRGRELLCYFGRKLVSCCGKWRRSSRRNDWHGAQDLLYPLCRGRTDHSDCRRLIAANHRGTADTETPPRRCNIFAFLGGAMSTCIADAIAGYLTEFRRPVIFSFVCITVV